MRVMYVAVVEVETRREVDHEAAMKLLGDYEPSFAVSTRGWSEVRLRLSATGLAHACTKASALARAATGAESIACQVMTQQEYRARHQETEQEPVVAPQPPVATDASLLPRQASQPWEHDRPRPGRHSA